MIHEFELAITPMKQQKPFVVRKVKEQLITVQELDGSKHFARISKNLDDQVSLKPRIPSLCFKP